MISEDKSCTKRGLRTRRLILVVLLASLTSIGGAAKRVTVAQLDITAIRRGTGEAGTALDADALVTCSSGTYIRAIARDLGAALGTGGHLTALRRTRVGPYRAADAATLDELARADGPAALPVVPLAAARRPSSRQAPDRGRQ